MTGLRTCFGLDIAKWQERYQFDFFEKYQKVLEKYQSLLYVQKGRLKITPQGMELLDTILVDFLMEDC